MEKNTVIVAVVTLLVGLGIGYMTWGTSAIRPGSHMMSDGTMMGQNIDQHFIVQMIPHHEGAIAMAKIALERSKRPEVLSLAKGIIAAQEKENRDMRAWYQSWYGSAAPSSGMGMMHMGGMTGDLNTLASAADFDREFITQMIPHHEMAIMMAQMLQASTGRNEMKQLAANIIASQSQEIDLMRGWLKAWPTE